MKLFLLCVFITAGSVNAWAQTSVDNKVLLTVGNDKVKVSEFLQVYEKNNTQTDKDEAGYLKDYLDLYINFKLKVKEAEALKLDTIPSFVKELAGYRKQLAKPYFIDESVNEALLQEAYDRKQFDIRGSHILIMVDENATAADTLAAYEKILKIKAEIDGGMDFAEAAVAYSDDPSAKDREAGQGQPVRTGNKGDLGYFTVFNMVYPFENVAYATTPGTVSDPVRTKFGYHLIYVKEKSPALGAVQVAHIYVAVRADASEDDAARKTEKVDNIYAKIQGGMSFEDAVVQYSEDKGSARNGGELSKFTCNRVVPEFVVAAKSLEVGEVSAPVKTMYGYHIIKLLSRETPGTFEDEKNHIKDRVTKDKRAQKSEKAVIAKIKSENGYKVYEKAKLAAFSSIDTSVLVKKYKADTTGSFSKPIIRIGKHKVSQQEFLQYVEDKQQKQENMDRWVYLEKLFGVFSDEQCMVYEDSQLEAKYPDFKALMQEYHDGILLFNLTDEKVWSKAVKDTLGLQKFFEMHRGDYRWDERANATVYSVRDKEEVQKVMTIIKAHDNAGDVAAQIKADSLLSVKIEPDIFEKGDNKLLDQVDWKAGNIEVIQSDVEQLVSIVKINEVLEPAYKELDDSRGIVTADYQNHLEKEWIKALKSKYPVVVNEEVLRVMMSEK